jgi:naphthoate synthase
MSAADSYSRVHDDVSLEPPEWRAVMDQSGKPFIDVIYEKAVGEGIAKA